MQMQSIYVQLLVKQLAHIIYYCHYCLCSFQNVDVFSAPMVVCVGSVVLSSGR